MMHNDSPKFFGATEILQRVLGLVRPLRQEETPHPRYAAKRVARERRVARNRARNKVARKSRRTNRLAAKR